MNDRDPIACESCKVTAPARHKARLSNQLVAGAVVGVLVLLFLIWRFI